MPKTDSQWLMDEEWKPIPGYEGLYSVSNLGRVKSHDRYVKSHHQQKLMFRPERILKPHRNFTHWFVTLYDADGLFRNAHVGGLVAHAFLPNPTGSQKVSYKDGDRANNKASNLQWNVEKQKKYFNYNYR